MLRLGLIALLATSACGKIGFAPLALDDEIDAPDAAPVIDDLAAEGPDASTAVPTAITGPVCGAASSLCGGVTDTLCESFEGADPWPWGYICNGDGYQCDPAIPEVTVAATTDSVCAGSNALELRTEGGPGTQQNGYLGGHHYFADTFFMRVYLKVPAASPLSSFIIAFTGDPDLPKSQLSGEAPRIGVGSGPGQLRVSALGTEETFDAGLARDEWQCLEIGFSADAIDLWIDEEAVHTYVGATREPGLVWKAFGIGITGSDDNGATTMFIDELAVSDTRIGCGLVTAD